MARALSARFFGRCALGSGDRALREISTPAYERIGAPPVGVDPAADAWIINARKAQTPEDVAAVLKQFAGYYVVRLVKCDGVPIYSNGGLYEGVDETSFRGQFLDSCTKVIDRRLLAAAWEHKFPEEAVAYGQELLAAAEHAEKSPRAAQRTFLSRLVRPKADDAMPLAEQLEIVRAAGRWYVFWGERGHAVRAYF